MKHEVIKTDNYLLVVDDSDIKEGDWFYQVNLNKIIQHDLKNGLILQPQSFDKKIISHLPLKNSPILEGVPLLPPIEQEDDVEKLADNFADSFPISQKAECGEAYRLGLKDGYWNGYTARKEKKSLSQPIYPKYFECETQGQTEWVGKWIY